MSENQMELEEAKKLLAGCYRVQYGSGNCEVDWYERQPSDDDQTPIANGQFWADGVYPDGLDIFLPSGRVEFTGDDARALFSLGKGRESVAEN